MNRFEFSTVNFLVLSIPVLLISGPFLADAALSVSCILFLIFIVRTRQFILFKDNFFIIFLLFYALIMISCFQSDYLEKIFFKNIFYFRFGIFLLLVKYIINKNEKFVNNLKKVLILTFIVLLIDSLIQFTFGKNIFGFSHPPGRITSFFGDESVLGSYVVRFSPLLIALICLTKGKFYEIMLIISSCFIISFVSGERAAIFLLLLFTSILFLIWRYDFKKKLIFFSIALLFILTTFIAIIKTSEKAKFRLIDQTLSQINFNYKNNEPFFKSVKVDDKRFILERNDTFLPLKYALYFETSKKIFLDNLIFGSGAKSYRYISSTEDYMIVKTHAAFRNKPKDFEYPGYTNVTSSNMHPHNIYLQLFSETGLFGGLFVLFIFIYITLMVFFSKISFEKKIILISLIINLFPFMTSGNFFNNWVSIVYFYPLGILYLKKNN